MYRIKMAQSKGGGRFILYLVNNCYKSSPLSTVVVTGTAGPSKMEMMLVLIQLGGWGLKSTMGESKRKGEEMGSVSFLCIHKDSLSNYI